MLPLDGVKVVDLTRVLAGPYATMVLGDLGAEVTKIERFPEGDDSRRFSPKINGESACFAAANRNKRSIALDLKSAAGRAVALRLIDEADVVVENFRPGVTERLGLDYETVAARNPALVYCSITGFGQTGPYRLRPGYDIIAQGVTGIMRMTGEPGGRPAKVGIAINDVAAGTAAVQAVLAAHIHRLNTGEGQYIDLSLVDSGLAWTVWESAAYFAAGEVPEPAGTRHRRSAPYQAFRTSDGYVTAGGNNERLWRRLCTDVLGRPDLLEDPRFATLDARMANLDELESEIESVLMTATTAEWVARLDDAGVPGGPVYTYDEALNDEHVRARGMIDEMDHPRLGRMPTLASPMNFSRTPVSIRRPAPLLGQHTRDVLTEAGFSADEVTELFATGVVHEDDGPGRQT